MKISCWSILTESVPVRSQSLTSYIDFLCSDIMWLLSSKVSYTNSQYEIAPLLNYGLTELNRFNPESVDDKNTVRDMIERLLKRHEPRLKNICVLVQQAPIASSLMHMFFQIRADVMINHSKQLIILDSTINPSKNRIIVKPVDAGSL